MSQQYTVNRLGRYKAEALAETLERIAPYCTLRIDTAKVREANLPALLAAYDATPKRTSEANS
ncbi:hypothetical protein [uncultured Intestinimonas sp.]|uniref:hypothetical protein n=1 Tax=uncultured Intestinimonas sp. TaxID=1689265 RepID=UPI0025ED1F71|nr:hypothetical protein [uncultured Intestinimonas sp.]